MTKYITKRNGNKVEFDISKIENAVFRAACDVSGTLGWTLTFCHEVAKDIAHDFEKAEYYHDGMTVEEIQDAVEELLMGDFPHVAKSYMIYRYEHQIARQKQLDKEFFEVIGNYEDGYWATENSNKRAELVTTQRDYLAGVVSRDIARNYIFPKDIVKAHDEGIIHIHDMDYAAQKTLTNCCLINLEDMLQNGTVINGVTIDKPHRLITASTIASQIIACVASSQYGGSSITLTHLAPFVRDSYNLYLEKYKNRGFSEELSIKYAKEDTKKEIADSIQTLNYQINSLMTTNGQTPFLTIFLYLNETEEYKEELAALIEEMLNQRILGMKNCQGVYVTVAFPKLIYCLEEDNIKEGTKYWYLTELAAKCSAKRLVPDYISEKVMKQLKVDSNGNGHCFPSMGQCKL